MREHADPVQLLAHVRGALPSVGVSRQDVFATDGG